MPGLLESGALGIYLQRPVREDVERVAIRVAEGWLCAATGLSAWPSPVPGDLWAWALELAAIAYSNPEGLATRTVDDDARGWVLARRSEILAAAARHYHAGTSPVFSFPPAPPRVI